MESEALKSLQWAMMELEQIGPPKKAHDGGCHPDAGCDGLCVDHANWIENYWRARKQLEQAGMWKQQAKEQR